MRSVLMALVVLFFSLMMLQPVLLGRQAHDWDSFPQEQGVFADDRPFDVFYPSVLEGGEGKGGRPEPKPRSRLRRKRSLDVLVEDRAHLALRVFGKELRLQLDKLSDFLSPGFIVQRVNGNSSVLQEMHGDLPHCFYSGKVHGENDSAVSLSLCKGMRGLLYVQGKNFIIEPLETNSSSQSLPLENTPHVIHSLSRQHPSSHNDTSFCSSTDSFKHHRLKFTSQTSHFSEDLKKALYHTRHKRSVSMRCQVETMVVADSTMHRTHGDNLEHYLLTIMATVRSVYRHPSIGNFINIVLVKLVIFETPESAPFQVTPNAAQTLKDFCRWQSATNSPDDSDPHHHDTAILITRQDICRAVGKCDTLGLAELGTICDPARSCSIVEENGISAAYTVAHELGHVFSLPHDDNAKCAALNLKQYHVMAPTLDYNASPWDWSSCSRNLMTEFLDAGLAECLLDKPTRDEFKDREATEKHFLAPGQLYNVNKQCELVFGEGSLVCPYMNNTCDRLWCTNLQMQVIGCRTEHMPWADGTSCGRNKWCQMGKCVFKSELRKVNGGWGPWENYGPCTRTCGGGIMSSQRHCDNPRPMNSGRYCLGKRIKYRSCNLDPCPPEEVSFRELQCQNMSQKLHITGIGPDAKWVPKYSGIQMKDACKLICRATTSSSDYQIADKVVDGTKCRPDLDDICVNGKCRRAGCDNKLGSKMKRDRCGVCGGDNSSCKTITGSFNNAIYGYNKVVRIPSGATNINIYQRSYKNDKLDDTYLALADHKGTWVLNGEFIVKTERVNVKVQGGYLEYSGTDSVTERINSTRAILEDITVYVLSVGRLNPPYVNYSYTVSVGDNVDFSWSAQGPWKRCTRMCQGVRKRKIVCIRELDKLHVSKKHCKKLTMPKQIAEKCNTDCVLGWEVIMEGECSVRCGQGVRTRTVVCVKKTSRRADVVEQGACRRHLGEGPSELVTCTGECLATSWKYTKWSQCSKSCDGGLMKRDAMCVDAAGREMQAQECQGSELFTTAACNEQPCIRWEAGDWTGCTVTCGDGRRYRKVWCLQGEDVVDDKVCRNLTEPDMVTVCNNQPCPEWFAGGWGPCSVTCDKGVSMRAVKCRSRDAGFGGTILDDAVCDASKRPMDKRTCYIGTCPTSPPPTTTTPAVTTPSAPRWVFGSWTQCSIPCGTGVRHRYVSCVDANGAYQDFSSCELTEKPPSVELCINVSCGEWRTSAWSECSVSCGSGGVKTRHAACVVRDVQVEDEQCNASSRPSTDSPCPLPPCPPPRPTVAYVTRHWRVGPWSPCSTTCQAGYQRRQVVCHDDTGPSQGCDDAIKPDEIASCNSGPCPDWAVGEWQQCSAGCRQQGAQSRQVLCRLPQGQTLPDSNCEVVDKPAERRACTGECNPGSHRWESGSWSSCTVTCGRGLRSRHVTCVDEDGAEVDESLCTQRRPRDTRRCFRGRCPRWFSSKWSKCSVTCGEGVRERAVTCRDSRHREVEEEHCRFLSKPHTTTPCRRKECSPFYWKVEPWSQCSKTCGFGRKHRLVSCVSQQHVEVTSHLCDPATKPKMRRRCNEFPCPFIWNTGPWGQCSTTCGEGRQSRTVVCQAVTKEGWVLPGEMAYGCAREDRPNGAQRCSPGDCDSNFRWVVGEWGECDSACGFGRQRRVVQCTDLRGKKVRKKHCNRLYRPAKARQCYNGPCYAESCRELKMLTSIRKDGDYKLKVKGQLVSIYCMNMRRRSPKEYLTLHGDENFAEVYEERLRRTSTCPYNGSRAENCDKCRKKTYRQAGNTTYSKVRIDLKTLQVITRDAIFSTTHKGQVIPFGTAGDCYSSANCPQGRFSISLSGTGFIVSLNTTWILSGNQASQRIWRLREGEVIRGVCGGYCGVCSPDILTGLMLELHP